jgi:GH15 family glucan-1,4-alpha-glucosidase
MRRIERVDGYLPISSYGLIGDCRSAALVGADGSIDWLCLPRFDDASIFGRILDARKAGHWQIAPRGPFESLQRYSDRTNLLQTIFTTHTGRLVVTDFMPVHPASIERHARPSSDPRVIRLVECLGGELTVECDIVPAPDYGRADSSVFSAANGRFHADVGELHVCARGTMPLKEGRFARHMRSSESVAFCLTTAPRGHCPADALTLEHAHDLLRQTQEFWWRWVRRCVYTGPYVAYVERSALALKLMTYAPTGAMVAAPTTSLPEAIGAERNWDYRFTWLRDASFTLYAFFQLGLTQEAHAFFDWMTSAGIGAMGRRIDNLYAIAGDRSREEVILDHLDGYRGCRPVRIGNGATHQLQLDVYGEVLDSAYLYARFGGAISDQLWRDLSHIVDLAIDRWQEPDSSMWEVRGPPQQFTYSKVMCWVAVDRGLRIAERYRLPHDAQRWRAARRAIHRRVTARAWSEKLGAFTLAIDGEGLDASLLRLSQVRFLADRDKRVRGTVEAIAKDLGQGELIRRYRRDDIDDGVGGDEGGFLMCSFWLVDALAHSGRVEEAQRSFERLLTFSSPLGLFSEEADGRTGALLGNYPQAFTHLALVGAAVNIERARHEGGSAGGLGKSKRGGKRQTNGEATSLVVA